MPPMVFEMFRYKIDSFYNRFSANHKLQNCTINMKMSLNLLTGIVQLEYLTVQYCHICFIYARQEYGTTKPETYYAAR